MNSVDVEIARLVRREFARRPVDSTRLDVQSAQGKVSLAGIVTTLRDQRDINLKEEIALITKQLMRDRLVREVQDSLRLIQTEKEQEEANSRGRLRQSRH